MTGSAPMVSSVAEEIRRRLAPPVLLAPDEVNRVLPASPLLAGWVALAAPPGAPVSRMSLVPNTSAVSGWDCCDVLAVYRVDVPVPPELVAEAADVTLRELGAAAPLTYSLSMPTGVAGVRSSGTFRLGARTVWGQFTNYVVNDDDSALLVEHSVLVDERMRARFGRDVHELTERVYGGVVGAAGTGA